MIFGFCGSEVDYAVFQSFPAVQAEETIYSILPMPEIDELDFPKPHEDMLRYTEEILQLRAGALPRTEEEYRNVIASVPNNLAHYRVRNVALARLFGGFFFLATEENLKNQELHKLIMACRLLNRTVVAVLPMDFRVSDSSLLADCDFCVGETNLESLVKVLKL